MRAIVVRTLAVLVVALAPFAKTAAAGEAAADFPSRPIHLVVPSAPAGAIDALAREIATRLSQRLGVPVVVENRAGASGIVGTEAVAHAVPDGYTLLLATSATHAIASAVAGVVRYDPVSDFDPVIDLVFATSVVVVDRSMPVATLGDLVRHAHAHPGALAYASSGAGSANHLDMEVLSALTGMTLLHVPYRGTADGYRALLAGEVQVTIGAVTSALPYLESGRLRALAVMAQRRSPLLPDVPTLVEAGAAEADVRKWMGVMAPARTPPAVIERLHAALAAILASPDVASWLAAHGFEPAGGAPEDFRRTLELDVPRWKRVVDRVVRNVP